jgi:hypothetical protein
VVRARGRWLRQALTHRCASRHPAQRPPDQGAAPRAAALGPPPFELTVEIGALNVGLDRLTRRAATRLLAGPALGSRTHGDGESTRF